MDDRLLKEIKENPQVFKDLGAQYKDDYDFVLKVMDIDGMLLEHVSSRLRDNYDVVMHAVNSCGKAILFAGYWTSKSREIVMMALNNDPSAIENVNIDVFKDVLFLRNVLSSNDAVKLEVYKYLGKKFYNDDVFNRIINKSILYPLNEHEIKYISSVIDKKKKEGTRVRR